MGGGIFGLGIMEGVDEKEKMMVRFGNVEFEAFLSYL